MFKHRTSDTYTTWRCLKNRKTCKTVVKTHNVTHEVISINHHHNHDTTSESNVAHYVSKDSNWEDFVSKRETRCIRIDNFVYYHKSVTKGIVSWHCTHRGCLASAESDINLKFKILKNTSHNHPPKSDEFFFVFKNKPWSQTSIVNRPDRAHTEDGGCCNQGNTNANFIRN